MIQPSQGCYGYSTKTQIHPRMFEIHTTILRNGLIDGLPCNIECTLADQAKQQHARAWCTMITRADLTDSTGPTCFSSCPMQGVMFLRQIFSKICVQKQVLTCKVPLEMFLKVLPQVAHTAGPVCAVCANLGSRPALVA